MHMCVGQIRGRKVKSVSKGKSDRGNQGPPGPTCPYNSLAHINPKGDLPSGGTARWGQGQKGSNQTSNHPIKLTKLMGILA